LAVGHSCLGDDHFPSLQNQTTTAFFLSAGVPLADTELRNAIVLCLVKTFTCIWKRDLFVELRYKRRFRECLELLNGNNITIIIINFAVFSQQSREFQCDNLLLKMAELEATSLCLFHFLSWSAEQGSSRQ
jgi:hypothetical protein